MRVYIEKSREVVNVSLKRKPGGDLGPKGEPWAVMEKPSRKILGWVAYPRKALVVKLLNPPKPARAPGADAPDRPRTAARKVSRKKATSRK